MIKKEVVINKDFEEIFPGYLARREAEVIKLEECLEQSEFGVIETLGHNLAGCAAGYGLDELGLIGKQLEEAAINTDSKLCESLILEMKAYLKNLAVRFE